MSSVIVTKASVILAFKFVISGTGVENTMSLTYLHKKKLRGVIASVLVINACN
jgi:ABC-type antimicrobial peptide transport system permease subunit